MVPAVSPDAKYGQTRVAVGYSFAALATAALFGTVWNAVTILVEGGWSGLLRMGWLWLDLVMVGLWWAGLASAFGVLRRSRSAARRLGIISTLLALATITAASRSFFSPIRHSAMEWTVSAACVVYFIAVAILLRQPQIVPPADQFRRSEDARRSREGASDRADYRT